ncbi:hypothetical protein P3S68_020641 [Capsicum galapagoense]
MAQAFFNNGGTDHISRLLELLHASEVDSNVKMIILKGNGRAFCAGGDVAAIVHNIHQSR